MPACSSNNMAACDALADAVAALRRACLVVYPTETLYGLGADALEPVALQRLVAVKGREPGKPISVLVSDFDMLADVVESIPSVAGALAQRFWPGPLTMVLPARAGLSDVLTGGSGSIGVRISSHDLATQLVRGLGRPVTTPSANPAGQPPPRRIKEARNYFGDEVSVYLGTQVLPGEPASTVLDLRGKPRVLRAGVVTAAAIAAAIGEEIEA